MCKMEVNNKPIRFQIDTGASVNMIPRHLVKSDIRPYQGILSMWNNTVVKPDGITAETIHSQSKESKIYCVDFVVFNDKELDCAPILGLSTSEKMKPVKLQHPNFVKAIQIKNYDTVFSNDLGELPGLQSLTVDKYAKPIIMADRRTPVALRSKLESELKRLVKLNVLAPVDSPTPWVSQIVVTQKKSGQIRVCIDPHELNKSLCHEHYTLPVLDDILHKMKECTILFNSRSLMWVLACEIRRAFQLLDHIPNMLWKIMMAPITIWIESLFGNFSKKIVRYILQLRWCHMYS